MSFYTNIRTTVLDNGLTVITAQRQTHSSLVAVAVNAGSSDENDVKQGTAHFLEHMMFNGTSNREDSFAISSEIESLGSSFNAYTSARHTVYFVEGLGKFVDNSLDLLTDMVTNIAFNKIEKERDVILQEFAMTQTNGGKMVYNGLKAAAYPGSALGRETLGTEETITNINVEDDLAVYHKANYFTQNMIVFCGGNVDHDEFVKKVKASHVMKLPQGQKVPTEKAEYVGGTVVIPSPPKGSVKGRIAFPVKRDERVLSYLLTDVLSGGMSSPLFVEVREKLGLCYHVSAHYSNDTELFVIAFETTKKNLKKCFIAIGKTLRTIAENGITDADWTLAKNKALVEISKVDEEYGELMQFVLADMFDEGRSYDNVGGILEEAERTSREQVQAFHNDLINRKPSISLYGDMNKKIIDNYDLPGEWLVGKE
jgi:predicted Zn-dependent peptidase